MATKVSTQELRASIEKHNEVFENLLRLIPARFYVSREPDEAEVRILLSLKLIPVLISVVLSDVLKVYEEQEEAGSSKAGH
jgi:hypothetical protein